MGKNIEEQCALIVEHVQECISPVELKEKLQQAKKENRPLRVKIGFDPTARDIHLGHTVLLRKLRKIQELGHEVYFIIGDFTARIGDPSGRTQLRPVLSEEQIKDNAKTYTEQAFKILDRQRTKIFFNSQWYEKMPLSQFLQLLSKATVARMIERDDFSKRLKENQPLGIHELVYPLVQGYDSVYINADIEFGGTDQKFNLIVGRHLQENFNQPPQVVITMPLLVGIDGKQKMSKSLGNFVGITEPAEEMFGKLMSISDQLMWEYLELLTDIDKDSLKDKHPKEVKIILAENIVGLYHGWQEAKKAKENFIRVFSQKEIPEDVSSYYVQGDKADLINVLPAAGVVPSRNEVRRLLSQRAISDSQGAIIQTNIIDLPEEGIVLKIGKRRFLKIIPS